jgi:hypothetical protein
VLGCDGNKTIHYSDGSYCEGEVKKGQRQGQGTLTLPNGDVLTGRFEYGEYVGP